MNKILMLGVTAILLSGCAGTAANGSMNADQARAVEKQVRESADYWQRSDDASAQYLVGPKAQYQLHSDIASCVAEVRELVRLGSIRKAEPPKNIAMDKGLKGGWTTVTRNGPLFAENQPFQDFDGCMNYKGWERVNFVKPITAENASQNYSETILGVNRYGATSSTMTQARETQPTGYNN